MVDVDFTRLPMQTCIKPTIAQYLSLHICCQLPRHTSLSNTRMHMHKCMPSIITRAGSGFSQVRKVGLQPLLVHLFPQYLVVSESILHGGVRDLDEPIVIIIVFPQRLQPRMVQL